jgi:hypothetical protein
MGFISATLTTMMFEPTEHDVNEAVRQSMNMFERARVGDVAATEPRQPRKVLLVLDGSSQDDMSIAVARALHDRFECEVDVVDAQETSTDTTQAEAAARLFFGRALSKSTGESFEQILTAISTTAPDLTIVPCPFGRDLASIGSDSTGTVIDVLLARAPCSLLVIRQPEAKAAKYFQRVLLLLNGRNRATDSAASWAVGMSVEAGELTLKLDLSQQTCDDIQQLVQTANPEIALSSEQLKDAMQKPYLSLHQALHAAADGLGLRYRLEVNCAEQDETFEWASSEAGTLAVVGLDRSDPMSQGRVRDRIRGTSHCILVAVQAGGSRTNNE